MDGLRLVDEASPFFSVVPRLLACCILLNYCLKHHISRAFEMNNMGKQSKRTKSTTGSSSGTGPERQRVELKIGYRVVLDGLKSTAYNDRRGTIHSLPTSGQANGRYGILLDGFEKPVGIRREHIVLLSTNPKTTEEKRRERERTSVDPQYRNVDFEQLQNVAALLSAFESMQRPSNRRSPAQLPDLYQELLSCGGIPLGIRKEWAKKYLFSIRNQSIGFPQSAEMELKSENFEPSTRDVYQRINSNHPKKVRWYCDRISNFSKPGAVFPMDTIADDERTVYGSLVRQSFSNSVYLKEALYKGTTHVAVGLFGHFFLSSLGPFSIESSGTAGRGSIISCLGRLALVSTRYPGSVYPGSVTIHVHLFWQQLPRHGNFEYRTCNVGRLLSAYK